jgi:hypothetical protein
MAINFDTLFAQLGKGFYAIDQINEAVGTTIPPHVKTFSESFDGSALELREQVAGVEKAATQFQSSASSARSTIASKLEASLITTVDLDVSLARRSLTDALRELIEQMDDQSETVDASSVSAAATAASHNAGDGVCVVSIKRPDGRDQENALAETITLECSSAASPATAVFSASTPRRQTNRLSHDWPKGSGSSRSLTCVPASSSLLGNGSFDDETVRTDSPDDWIVAVGTIGTTLKVTDYEVQQIVVSDDPEAGTYTITWANPAGKSQTTVPLAYDASGSDVQAALRALVGLESITVATTGTSPNYTHTLTFTGVGGNLSEVTVTNLTDVGTITPGTTSAGSAGVYSGKALELDSNGSEETTIYRAVALAALSQYAFALRAMADVVPAAGVLTVDLVDGIGGSVIDDEQGTANSFTIDATGLATSFAARTGVFRTPRELPPIVYLRIRISTAVSSGSSVFLDHAALAAMVALYAGGPEATLFSGIAPFSTGSEQVLADRFSIAVENDRGGGFQEWFQRAFDMTGKGLLLPSDDGGNETLDDALIGAGDSSSSSGS